MNNVKISLTGTYALLGLTISLGFVGAEDSEELVNAEELNIKGAVEGTEEGAKDGAEDGAEEGAEEGAEKEFNCSNIC